MLTSTFCHIRGIAEKTERKLWSAGVLSWDCALDHLPFRLPSALRGSWRLQIEESVQNYESRNANYFYDKLPSNQHWRLYRDFEDRCAFLDVETTGIAVGTEITTIALYDGRCIRYYVNGQNLQQFVSDVQDYSLLVTYNGKQFDVPLIERYFGVKLSHAHIDLRYALRSLGLTGGLKNCEQQLGIARPPAERLDGFAARLLWDEWRCSRNSKALETLLAYNIRDAVVLRALMVHTFNAKLKDTPFFVTYSLSAPSLPPIPFEPDLETVRRVQSLALEMALFPRVHGLPPDVWGSTYQAGG